MKNKFFYIILTLLIIVMCAFGSFWGIYKLSDKYEGDVNKYIKQFPVINLRLEDDEKSKKALDYLLKKASEQNIVVVRADDISSNETAGYRFGYFIPSESSLEKIHSFPSFLGRSLYTKQDLQSLLTADKMKTLGVETSKLNSIVSIPNFLRLYKIVVYRLNDLIEHSNSTAGIYLLDGVNKKDYEELLKDIHDQTGKDIELLARNNVISISDNLFYHLFSYILITTAFLLIILVIVFATTLYKKLGTYLLLGWSKYKFASVHFVKFILISFISIPMMFIAFFQFSEGFVLYPKLVFSLLQVACVPIIAVVVAVVAGFITLGVIKPVKAIRNQLNFKLMLYLMAVLYVFVSLGTFLVLKAIDGPLQEVDRMTRLNKNWADQKEYHILYAQEVGQDEESFTRRSMTYTKDFYNWYKSIDHQSGVYLINSSYISDDLLKDWRTYQSFEHIPSRPYWKLTANANYLKKIGMSISDDVLKKAENGVRVYFIPSSYSKKDKKALEDYLLEYDKNHVDGTIKTSFMKNPRFEFITYSEKKPIFTWATRDKEQPETTEAVICLTDPNNMIWFENESLSAGGLENSYIKLDTSAVKNFTNPSYLKKYHLDDNVQTWVSVQQYVDGLQKSIWTFIKMFLAMAIFLFLLSLMLVMSISYLFVINYRERIVVKRLLGYGLINIFIPIILVVLGINILGVVISIWVKSNAAVLYFSTGWIIQLILFFFYSRKIVMRQISQLIKEN